MMLLALLNDLLLLQASLYWIDNGEHAHDSAQLSDFSTRRTG